MNQSKQRLLEQSAGQVVHWVDALATLPDDDVLVLVALDDGEVWPALRDGDIWRWADAMPVEGRVVTHWMHLPAAPTGAANATRTA